MQRMKLHLSGVKLDKLGTLKDRMYRSYLFKEAQLESSKTEFLMYLALTNPVIDDQDKRSSWSKEVNKSWKTYLGRLFTVEIPEVNEEEEALKEYYDRVVSKAKLKIRKDNKTGKVEVTGAGIFNE